MTTDNSAVIAQRQKQQEALEWLEWMEECTAMQDAYRAPEGAKKIREALDSELDEQPKDDYNMTYDYNIHANPDHEAWADFFIQTWPDGCTDRDTIAGWFANAMMAKADLMTSEKADRPTVPEGWSVAQKGNMYLVQKYDENGFIKGEWIKPEEHGYVICEMLSDMAQQKRRE